MKAEYVVLVYRALSHGTASPRDFARSVDDQVDSRNFDRAFRHRRFVYDALGFIDCLQVHGGTKRRSS